MPTPQARRVKFHSLARGRYKKPPRVSRMMGTMRPPLPLAATAAVLLAALLSAPAAPEEGEAPVRQISGWTVHVNPRLLSGQAEQTARALELLKQQLDEINRVVPAPALAELKKVPLYFSPQYPGVGAKAEYHPGAGWLKDNGRDPAMAKAVEFTNIAIFEKEVRRMPNFALHELAHAYHDRVLGYSEPRIAAAHAKAKASGSYDKVERRDAEGKTHIDKAYAMTNPQEYFAESTEAYFSRNDFFPYNREELKKHDPDFYALLETIWNAPAK